MPGHPQRTPDEDVAFDATFPARVDALPRQRQDFTGWLDDLGLGRELAEDLTVVFSELTANAVAGSPDDAAPVAAHAHIEGRELCIDIRNSTAGSAPAVRRPDLADPLREGGRGLMIVRALVDDLDVVRDGRDLAVRCRYRIHDGRC